MTAPGGSTSQSCSGKQGMTGRYAQVAVAVAVGVSAWQ